jgi:hypothetical protein
LEYSEEMPNQCGCDQSAECILRHHWLRRLLQAASFAGKTLCLAAGAGIGIP